MNEQHVAELIEKYNEGTLTRSEKVAMDLWYLKYAAASKAELSAEKEQQMVETLKSILPLHYQKPPIKIWPKIISVAAVLAIVMSCIFWLAKKDPNEVTNDVAPGKTGAILTLANGRKIHIGNYKAGNLSIESGVKISKTATGQIIYEMLDAEQSTGKINSLETSRGEEAQIKLPDGTTVYLNASSSLRYPSSFANSTQRIVEFVGEGFFKVAPDKSHPFIVKTAGQKLEVLGTQFNINSYPYYKNIKTTLIEGSIIIENDSKVSKIMKPGQQAIVSKTDMILKTVETDYVMAWKNGYFMFNHETLEEIMSKLSQWYKINVVYDDPELKNKVFFGSISRFENISKVLKVMERTHVAKFEIKDNNIIIKKP